MNEQEQTRDLQKALISGLKTLSDPEIKVSASEIENLTYLKGLLKAVLEGKVVISPADDNLRKDRVKLDEDKDG